MRLLCTVKHWQTDNNKAEVPVARATGVSVKSFLS